MDSMSFMYLDQMLRMALTNAFFFGGLRTSFWYLQRHETLQSIYKNPHQ